MAVDIQNLFNNVLPAELAKNAEAAKQIGAKYQINITGEGGGKWYIDVSDSGPKVDQGEPGSADCTITLDSESFQKLHENPQANGTALFFGGKLKVAGNPALALKLQKLFDLGKVS
jgi:putative sterol carrier protein